MVMLKSALINQANPALTVSEISYDEYQIRPVNFQDAIDFSAGLWITNSENQAQDNRMAIRGFGARSAFGIRGLKIILDGVPLTTPDGQSQVDNIPFQLIENVEIMKSLSSTRYGNASGGVVSINTFLILLTTILWRLVMEIMVIKISKEHTQQIVKSHPLF